ncbi:MAG: hypothetical protein HC925_09135 [Coleofasciculaceae cyanobacterium SM2_3_26]|nr:hypothetical protein [Coleofasciculaceae cyanobacterium SM2_3_26]
MPAAPIPADENARLEELRRYAVLDTPPDTAFDDLTYLAANLCQTPVSLISLVDKHRQWFKSRCGLQASETPRQQAFCGYTILAEEPFVVEDATLTRWYRTTHWCCRIPRFVSMLGAIDFSQGV